MLCAVFYADVTIIGATKGAWLDGSRRGDTVAGVAWIASIVASMIFETRFVVFRSIQRGWSSSCVPVAPRFSLQHL